MDDFEFLLGSAGNHDNNSCARVFLCAGFSDEFDFSLFRSTLCRGDGQPTGILYRSSPIDIGAEDDEYVLFGIFGTSYRHVDFSLVSLDFRNNLFLFFAGCECNG